MTIDPQGVTFLGSPPLWDFTVPVATSPFTQGGSVVAPSRRVQSPMRQRPETVDLRMRKSIRTVLVWGDGLHLLPEEAKVCKDFMQRCLQRLSLGKDFGRKFGDAFGSICWGLEERERCQIDSRIDDGLRKQAWEAWQVGFMGLQAIS